MGMGSVLLNQAMVVMVAMVTMESERLSQALDIMAMDFHITEATMDTMGSVLLNQAMVVMVAMVTMESERLNPAMDIMAMDSHITEAMCSMANPNGRLPSQNDTQGGG